ncbi:MAG: hypothetical protein PHT21_05475 [Lachnospiraceae bacterium]|nr:hypothetical protein [Lachnospiraceae bacterium]
MKGIIVELRGQYAALLTEEGCVTKIKNHHYQIGQEVVIMKSQKIKTMVAVASAAAGILLVSGISSYAYFNPYSTVSLDVNPSVEFTANRFDRVLSVEGMNEDGQELLQTMISVRLKNKSIDDAMELVIREMTELGYLDNENSQIYIGTTSKRDKKAEILAESLKESTEIELNEMDIEADVDANAIGAERVLRARELGVTPGKLNLAEKLVEEAGTEASLKVEDWIGKTVKEIMDETNRYRERNRIEEKNEHKEEIGQSLSENKPVTASGNGIKKKVESKNPSISENDAGEEVINNTVSKNKIDNPNSNANSNAVNKSNNGKR